MLIGALVSLLYFGDTIWWNAETLSGSVFLQIGLFATVALATGWLGDRLRRAGMELGVVESELRQLRLDTGDILGNISTGVLTVDGSECLVYMNRSAEQMLGLEASEWLASPVLVAVENVAPGLGTLLRRSSAERVSLARYKTVARRNGRDTTLGISTTVLSREDGEPSVTAIFQDITDLERVAELNRRNERLEAVAELSASLAHEIKNPLASIRSAVEQLTNPALASDDRSLLQGLVVNESDRLSRLLSEFLEFSRVRIGQVEQVDINRVVRDVCALARQHPEADGGIVIRPEGAEGELRIPGDADLIHRALFNLVLNGIQFAGEGGEVVVRVSHGDVPPDERGVFIPAPVRISVQDTGPGIEPARLSRVFDPFFTTRPGGSGLGLAMVHRAVEAHTGVVLVNSKSDRGAEFVIYLPGETPVAQTSEAS